MFWNILSLEHTKIFRRRMFWVELALVALLVVGLDIGLFAFYHLTPSADGPALPPEAVAQIKSTLVWPTALPSMLVLVGRTGLSTLLVITLVGAATAQDYTWRTMPLWLSRGASRPALLWAKFGALLVPTLLIVLAPLAASAVPTALFSWLMDGSLHLDQLNPGGLALSVLCLTLSLLPYAGLAFLLAIATRSTVAVIGGGLAYTLIVENLLAQILSLFGGWVARAMQYLPGGLSNVLLTLGQGGPQAASGGLTPEAAAIGLGLYTLLFCGLALLIFRRQDLTA